MPSNPLATFIVRLKIALRVLRGGMIEGFREVARNLGKKADNPIMREMVLSVLEGDMTRVLLEEVMGLPTEEAQKIAQRVTGYLGYVMVKTGHSPLAKGIKEMLNTQEEEDNMNIAYV